VGPARLPAEGLTWHPVPESENAQGSDNCAKVRRIGAWAFRFEQRASFSYLWSEHGPPFHQYRSTIISVPLSGTSWAPLEAKSLRSQTLYFVVKRVKFLSVPRALGFRRICGAQFFQRFLDGKFGCFGHCKPHIQATGVQKQEEPRQLKPGASPSASLTASDPAQVSVDLDQHELCSGELFLGQCPLGTRSLSPQGGAGRAMGRRPIP